MTIKEKGSTRWKSPSNIALVKYWGKYENQIPANPSISFTLKNSHTETYIEYKQRSGECSYIDFYFEGTRNEQFANRVRKYITRISEEEPVLQNFDYKISSRNSFPHSSGIASSASSLSALALGLTDIIYAQKDLPIGTDEFFKQASAYARLGSGSACRSLFPHIAVWGKTEGLEDSSNELAVPVHEQLHAAYKHFCNAILIIDAGKKDVSSTVGHSLMQGHPYAEQRFRQAENNMQRLLKIMKGDDFMSFFSLVEQEALALHSMMMTSDPYYILMKPGTLAVLEKVRKFRERTQNPVGFTLDAGANVHILYPPSIADTVKQFIESELLEHCEEGTVIYDETGEGPVKVN